MDELKRVEIFKREFPDTQLKRGALLALFDMWKFTKRGKMLDYIYFLQDIGITTEKETRRIIALAEGKNEKQT